MYLKEYRICMPITVEEYRIGQLYMIAKHSHEQSEKGEGVEVVTNEPCEHPEYGKGQFTEKRVHLSSKLPQWIRSMIPPIFYITEKAWNYYPYTITEYTCSFIPRFTVQVTTKYEDNNGSTENCLNLSDEELSIREVDFIDIVNDPLDPKHYKVEEDLTKVKSSKTQRGPFASDWKDTTKPIMCSYKVVRITFEVWGLQTKVESYAHKAVRDVNLLGHRQAISWLDEWIDMTMEDMRNYEKTMHKKTNEKVLKDLQQEEPTEQTEES